MSVGIGQIRFGRGLRQPKMIEFTSAGLQAAANFAQTVRLRQLAEGHRYKMSPTVKALQMFVGIMFFHDFIKSALIYQIQHLTKQTCRCILHYGALLWVYSTVIYCYGQSLAPPFSLFSKFVWTHVNSGTFSSLSSPIFFSGRRKKNARRENTKLVENMANISLTSNSRK